MMNKDALKEMIKRIMQEVIGEEYKDSYAAQRSAELRKKRDAAIEAARREYQQSREAQGKISKDVFKKPTKENVVKKEVIKHMNESRTKNTSAIRLKDLLTECMIERRVNLVRVQTVMEKLYPELNEGQSKKLMELCTEVHMFASQLNMTPYNRTESSLIEWKLMAMALQTKLNELKEEVIKVCEDKKIDSTTVVKALETVLEY
jgi:hypothetical protein